MLYAHAETVDTLLAQIREAREAAHYQAGLLRAALPAASPRARREATHDRAQAARAWKEHDVWLWRGRPQSGRPPRVDAVLRARDAIEECVAFCRQGRLVAEGRIAVPDHEPRRL